MNKKKKKKATAFCHPSIPEHKERKKPETHVVLTQASTKSKSGCEDTYFQCVWYILQTLPVSSVGEALKGHCTSALVVCAYICLCSGVTLLKHSIYV